MLDLSFSFEQNIEIIFTHWRITLR